MTKVTELKSDNIHSIRTCFYNGNIWTKNELAKQTGLSLAATTNILQFLVKGQEIKFVGEAKSTGGRKSKQYILNKDYGHIVTLVLKRDAINYYFSVESCNLLGEILDSRLIVSKTGTVNDLLEILNDFLKNDYKITILALSVPGVCNDGKISICDFDELNNTNLKEILKEKLGLKVVIENDVNIASIGFSNHYPDTPNLVLMYQPKVKYIGCGIIIDHKLCRGFTNFAGELSYLPYMTHFQQDRMLQNEPNDLLLKQLVTICCVINPELIGICSDAFDLFDKSELNRYLPREHWPKIVDIKNLDYYICKGLFSLAINKLKKQMRKREI